MGTSISFLLRDIVTSDYAAVRFHAPFFGFDRSPIPADIDAYRFLSTPCDRVYPGARSAHLGRHSSGNVIAAIADRHPMAMAREGARRARPARAQR